MRTVYHEHLTKLAEQLSRLCGLSGAIMERATRALLHADLAHPAPNGMNAPPCG